MTPAEPSAALGLIVPGMPHVLLAADKNAGWARLQEAFAVARRRIEESGADQDLAPLVELIENNRAHQLCLDVEDGRLVGLKTRFNSTRITGSLAAFTQLRSLQIRWGNAGPIESFDPAFFDAPVLEEVELQSGAVAKVPDSLRTHPTLQRLVVADGGATES